jgi:hypothetical protein
MKSLFPCLSLALLVSSTQLHAATVWSVGADDNDWPVNGLDGGLGADFLQEDGSINALPGSPLSPSTAPRTSDNDYYFAGTYSLVPSGVQSFYGSYTPVGTVASDETAWERAFAGGDNDLRIHFNLADTFQPGDLATISFDPLNLHTGGDVPDSRYGIELYFNGVLVRTEQIIRPGDLNNTYTSNPFTLGSVGAVTGPGADNVVSLKGISYSNAGGGAWMGIDYVKLDVTPIPEPGSALLASAAAFGAALSRRRSRKA